MHQCRYIIFIMRIRFYYYPRKSLHDERVICSIHLNIAFISVCHHVVDLLVGVIYVSLMSPSSSQNFREQRIDGAGLPLLTEEHLTGMLQMKLGPALKLRAVVARRLEPCAGCQTTTTVTPATTPTTTPRLNGAALKPEPRSNSTSPS